jgi:spermidine synthase
VLAAALASRSYEEPASGVVRRDHTATVVSIGAGMGRLLLVNGIGMTVLTTDTKLMAHLPMLALGRPPETALSICFGMGTSHRSLLSWGARATAVELVPSVLEAFGYYFDDAAEVRANPLGEEVVDDGRRFLRRSREKFDVVVIDPPPPMESAGSSLLYSEEFYSLIKTRMTEGAVLQQWLPYQPGGDLRILRSMAGALRRSFRRVRALRSADGWGFHFLASDGPLALPPPAAAEAAMPPSARRDLSEWSQGASPAAVLAAVYAGETDVRDIAPDGSPLTLTDDEPVNEYFLVRRLLAFFLHPR